MVKMGIKDISDVYVGTLNAIQAYFGTEKVWEKSAPPTGDWLCFTAEEANSTVAMAANGSAPTVSLEYSTNGSTWSPFVVGTTTVTLANIGDYVYVRATSAGNSKMATTVSRYNYFVMTGKIAASGNVDTLLKQDGDATLIVNSYIFLFKGCESLTTAPELPATTLANSCYRNMFSGCTSLTTAPSLPATTLTISCYFGMFEDCSSLTTAPALPATTLASSCYSQMFYGCYNLNSITLGYTGNFADAPSNAFSDWVNGVAASGTFYYDGSDTTTGTSAIPVGWTVRPTRPELGFTAQEANATVSMTKGTYAPTLYLQTSVDNGETWQTFTSGSTTITLANIGDKVLFRTTPGRTNLATAVYNPGGRRIGANSFSFGGKVKVSGRLDSLLYSDFLERDDIALRDYCFWHLFYKCPNMRGTIDCSNIGACGQSTFGETFSEDGITDSTRWSIEKVDFSGLNTIYAANPTSGQASQLSSTTFYATFDSCNSLSCLSLPNLTNDGRGVNQCGNLNNICYNNSGLQVVDLSNLKKLYKYGLAWAFMNCVGLRKVYLTNLEYMGANGFEQTFYGCSMLELVDFSNAAAIPSLGGIDPVNSTFANTNNTYKVVVPDALYNDWVSDPDWNHISSHIVKASEYTPT